MNIPPLAALRALDAVARLGSVRRAAIDLGVDHTVVSRHLRSLQALVDTPLLHTGRQGVSLTPAGRDYAAKVALALATLADATRALMRPNAPAGLTIGCLPGFALRWLTPHLPDFRQAFPGIEISLRPGDLDDGLADGAIDAQIAYGPPERAGERQAVLGTPRVFPVASPFWLAQQPGLADDLSGLTQAPLIHEQDHAQWRDWLRLAGLTLPPALTGPCLWHAHLAVEAAKLGQGVALANELICARDLANGELVEVGRSHVAMQPYVLVCRASRWNEPALVRFRRWLLLRVRRDLVSL